LGIAIGAEKLTWTDMLVRLLASPSIASKQWIYRQYDHQVQNNTILFPGGADAAVIRLRPQLGGVQTRRGVAATTDCNARYVYLDPFLGAQAAVAEAARNLSCVGAKPLAITNNLNFGSPEKPVGYWQLAMACQGMAAACRALDTPVTGGNVSLYNETLDANGNPKAIYPTPVIGMVGLVEDVTRVCGQGWRKGRDRVYLLGSQAQRTLGGSEYLARLHGLVTGIPPQVDFDLEQRVQAACRFGIAQGWIQSAHDCAEGGVAIALAECCISGQLGVTVELPVSTERLDVQLFGEAASQIIVSVTPSVQAAWEQYLNEQLPEQWVLLGQVEEAKTLTIRGLMAVAII
jgi:phosphoribosylformylglycinamidine synthase